jgi:hypothetical protein
MARKLDCRRKLRQVMAARDHGPGPAAGLAQDPGPLAGENGRLRDQLAPALDERRAAGRTPIMAFD